MDTPPEKMHELQCDSSIDRRVSLLVSVRNGQEAKLALETQVDWIDLKNPADGPLGRPSSSVAREVGEILAKVDRRSVALGELRDVDVQIAQEFAAHFPVLKVGLSGLAGSDWPSAFGALQRQLSQRGAELVPVVYADWAECNAPPPLEVMEQARVQQCRFLLVDTFTKDGRHLLDHLSIDALAELTGQAHANGTRVILAGSLQLELLPVLLQLPIEAVGVRGAVCDGSRTGAISKSAVKAWVDQLCGAHRVV